MHRISRRRALQSTAAVAAGALSTTPRQAPAFLQTRSGSFDVRLAVIGTGGRGGNHISGFSGLDGTTMSLLCDADENVVGRKAADLGSKVSYKVDHVTDYRRVLDRQDIDAVTIASPNHWHALMAIEACQAGKHVYVEKPVCHTVWEGRQLVKAAQKHQRVVAAGFQNRSDVGLLQAIPQIHEGRIGAITMARGLCYRNRGSIGKLDQPLVPPPEVNYDLWLGPAADLPIMRPRFHYDWHWVFNTGNGDMGNQGPHEMDLLQWALGEPGHPVKVMSFGGRFGWDDAGDTPNMQYALFDFGNNVPVIFEVRNLHQRGDNEAVGRYAKGPGVGIIITGEKGEFRGGRGGGAFYDPDGREVESYRGDSGRTHMENFLTAVREGKPELLRSPIESAYYSSSMSHLANISYRSGRDASVDELKSALESNPSATEVLERFNRQLELWDVDLAQTPWQLGPELVFDPASERFAGGDNLAAANDLLHREDRAPYIVPEIEV